MPTTKMDQLEKFLARWDDETMTKKDFVDNFEAIVNFIKKIELKNQQEIEFIKKTFAFLSDKINSEFSAVSDELKRSIQDEISLLREKIKVEELKIAQKLSEIKNGLDADETKIVQDVLNQIKLPEQKEVILDNAEAIRNKLEILQGNERLEISAIKNLSEKLDELAKSRQMRFGGGGFSKIAMDSHLIDD